MTGSERPGQRVEDPTVPTRDRTHPRRGTGAELPVTSTGPGLRTKPLTTAAALTALTDLQVAVYAKPDRESSLGGRRRAGGRIRGCAEAGQRSPLM